MGDQQGYRQTILPKTPGKCCKQIYQKLELEAIGNKQFPRAVEYIAVDRKGLGFEMCER